MSKENKHLRLEKRNATLAKKTKELKEVLLIQLAKYPILQTACDKAGVGRSTYYLWRKDDSEFRKGSDEALKIGKDFINDMCESMLIKNIQAANNTALIFWLKNHHPEYGDKILHRYELAEPEVTDEQQIQIGVAFHNIGMASIIRSNKRIQAEIDKRIENRKEKEAQRAIEFQNRMNNIEEPKKDPEDAIVQIGNAKPTTVREHLDRYEERKRTEAIKKLSPAELEYCKKYHIDPLEYKR